MKKSVYLDWNVFQDIIQDRRNEGLHENLEAATRGGYLIPYSCAHMRDLAKCGNPDYVKSDLKRVSELTGNWCTMMGDMDDQISYKQVRPEEIFSIVSIDEKIDTSSIKTKWAFEPYEVDTSALSASNIMTARLQANNNIFSSEVMESFLFDSSEGLLSDHKTQKLFRASLKELMELGRPGNSKVMDMPLYKHWLSSKEVIKQNLKEIADSFLSLSNKTFDRVPIGEKITTTYQILDFFPAFSEKLDRRNTQRNIATDAEHVYLASDSRYLVCGDANMLEKAEIIYSLCGIKTKVYHATTFQQSVTFI
jgi:hypothetical protein